jgi:hypothetical protein
MATPEELSKTFSFIGTLQADQTLAPYGNNALPIFALALHLGIEDVGSFAVDSLTDHPDDKKADVIYVDEAEGVACIAQGYTAVDWGKQEAPANKASDLNTAMAWLLQAPIEEVPDAIRGQAKLLRDGLDKKAITKLIVAYAHNAFESHNVEKELDAVRHLLTGLNVTDGVEIDVVELGLRQTEALYLTSQGSIQVTDELDLPAKDKIVETGPKWSAYIVSLSGGVLHDLYERHKNALFSANLRDFLGTRKVAGNVNNRIRKTAEDEPGMFFVLNNGITLVTKKAEPRDADLRIYGVSVVNGAQTTGAIHAVGAETAKKVSVAARIIVVDDEKMIPLIVAGNNTQNSIVAWDRRSNDAVQVRIKQEFESKGVDYIHRRDSSRKAVTSLFVDQVGQMLCAFGGDLQTAIRAKSDIFESDVTYNKVFPTSLSIGHIFAVQALGWAYDRVKQELKAKSAGGSMTEIEQKQLRLLDYPASKQFLVRIVGELREEIAGAKVTEPRAFELKEDAITKDGAAAIDAWIKVLKSILPSVVQILPAEEYQVVRSTEHTEAVATKVKGIVAGADILQDSFKDLRALLKLP